MMAIELERVYLARYGQTEWNRQGRRQGQLISTLTIDSVFSSPLGRACATADILADLVLPNSRAKTGIGSFVTRPNNRARRPVPAVWDAWHASAARFAPTYLRTLIRCVVRKIV